MNYYLEPIKQYHRKEKPNYFIPYYRERSSFIRMTRVQKRAQKIGRKTSANSSRHLNLAFAYKVHLKSEVYGRNCIVNFTQ